MTKRKGLTSRLSFRVAWPIVVLWALSGFAMYSVVLSTVSDFLNSRIQENVSSLARDVFIICNRNLDGLILEGRAGDKRYQKIIQVRTLSDIEIVLRESNGLAMIYSQKDPEAAKRVLLNMNIPIPEERIFRMLGKEQMFIPVEESNMVLYGYHFDFEPWDWHIVIFKPDADFAVLQDKIGNITIIFAVALTLGALLIIGLLHYLVNRPLSSIVASLKRGEPPAVTGVYELAFLSESIDTMMHNLADMNRRLEQKVAVRTRDLSEKAAELEKVNAKLQELDRMKSAFLSSVSHELRTPLTSVLGFAKMIDRDLRRHVAPLARDGDRAVMGKIERMIGNLHIIEAESERLTRLINDVLDLTRIEDGRMEWKEGDVPLHEAAAHAVESLRGQVGDKPGVTMVIALEETLPPMRIDPDRLQQVLINLIGNALKFTDSGAVQVHARYEAGAGYRLRISDDGAGIPREHLRDVFDSFFQSRQGDTVKPNQRGTGLGLAICRQIVEHYGGIIWVESAEGDGTAVYLEFPPELAAG